MIIKTKMLLPQEVSFKTLNTTVTKYYINNT